MQGTSVAPPPQAQRGTRNALARYLRVGSFVVASALLLTLAPGACHGPGRSGPEPGPVGLPTTSDGGATAPSDGSAASAPGTSMDAAGEMDAALAADVAGDAPTDTAGEDVLPYLRGEARRAMIQLTIERYNDVRACWLDAVLRQRGHRGETVTLHLTVAPTGRASAVIEDVEDPSFANCIRVRLQGHRYGPGDEMTVDATFRMSAQ